MFTATTSGSVNINTTGTIAGLDIQRDITFYGSQLTLGTTIPLVNTTIAAGRTVTFNNQLNRTSGTFTLGDGATLTFNAQDPAGGTYNLTNATINFNGNIAHSSNPNFYGTGTLNYGVIGSATTFRFNVYDSLNLVIKETSGGVTGNGGTQYLRYYGSGTLTLQRDLSLLNVPAAAISAQNGALAMASATAAAATVTGAYTGRFNQLVFLPGTDGTFRLDGSTLAIGDGTAGKVQGVFTGSPGGSPVNATNRIYALDATSNGGTVRVTGSSSFNNLVTGSAATNYGAQLNLTGAVALYNNGNWQNQNLTTTAVMTGISVGASATLGGTGTFDMSAVNGANAKNTLVSGTVAPGDPTLSSGIGTLTINTGTMSFGSTSALRLDVAAGANNNDRLVIGGIASVTAGAAISFNASGLDQGKYSLATATSGLSGFTSSSTPAAYRLAQSGTEIALFARPVQSVAGLSIGGLSRVMQNQSLTFTGTLSNSNPTGGDSLMVSLSQLGGSNLSLTGLTGPGSVASAGSQQISGTVSTGNTLGARTWGVTNSDSNATATTASGSGTLNVLGNRTVTAASVNFGVVRQGASGNQSFALTSNQADDSYTRVTVGNGSGGGFTVTGSSGFVFDGSGGSSRTLSGSFATAGVVSGSITLTNASAETGGTLTGQTPGTTSVSYTASVFDGHGTWNHSSGGSWGSQASSNWTSTGNVGAAPGTFGAGFTNTDIATFSTSIGSSTGTITLDGAQVSLASLSFTNTAGRYVIQKGTGSGSLTLAASAGKPFVSVLGTHEIATAILGTSGLQKTGVGKLILSGSSNYTGGTEVTGGTLAVNGSIAGNVSVLTGAELGGSGAITGILSGAGVVGPGNSPGILTATQFDPSGGLGAAFEFSAATPDYTSLTASRNDILRLTDSTQPFLAALSGGNAINVYFDVSSIKVGDTFEGGFFTTLSTAGLLDAVKNATFTYWVRDNASGTPYNGVNYSPLTSVAGITGASVTTVSRTASFGGSDPVPGSVTQFVIIPEPDTIIFAGVGIAMAGWSLWKRHRIAKILRK